MAVAMIGPKFYAWDRNGKPLAFGKLYTYQARTNTPKPTYQSEDQVIENTNPVILNGEGYANVYLDGSYKMVLKDSDDNDIWSSDPVSSAQPDEWVNCLTATYVTPTSFKVGGNFTSEYEVGRKVRIDNNPSEYGYSTIESSSFSGGETNVTIRSPIITTGIVEVCTSITGPKSGFSQSDLALSSVLIFPDISGLKELILSGGSTIQKSDLVDGSCARITTTEREGVFYWDSSDLSGKVGSDPEEGQYIALSGEDGSSGAWVNEPKSMILLERFGGDFDTAMQAAIDFAKQLSISNAGGSIQTERPSIEISLGKSKYTQTKQILIDDIYGIKISSLGGRTLIDQSSVSSVDYPFLVTGRAFNHEWDGIAFQCNASGAVKYDATNSSGSLVKFSRFRFLEDADRVCVAVDYTNRSSQVIFEHGFFHRPRTAAHFKNVDLITFDDVWFEPGVLSEYTSKDGYIRVDKGFCRVVNSGFSAGPSNAVGGATEVAFFNMGIDGGTAPTVDHAHLVLENTRIGFELGSGALVNWFVPTPPTAGASFNPGIIMINCETSPREDKVTVIDGLTAAPMFRLFTMPSIISVTDTINTQDRACIIEAGSTTTLADLRSEIDSPLYLSSVEGQDSIFSSRSYRVDGLTCSRLFIAATTDKTENAKWLELFGRFNYFFDSDATGSASEVLIDTFFFMTATPDNELETALFEVDSGGRVLSIGGGAGQQISPLSGKITCVYDSATGLISATWQDDLTYGALSRSWVVTPVFYNTNTLAESATVTIGSAPVSVLRLKVSNDNGTDVRLRGARVRPVFFDSHSNPFNGGVNQR